MKSRKQYAKKQDAKKQDITKKNIKEVYEEKFVNVDDYSDKEYNNALKLVNKIRKYSDIILNYKSFSFVIK